MESLTEGDIKDLLTRVESGAGLPSHWYTDDGVFAREKEQVLHRSWHYGAHTGQLENPGDVALGQVIGVPVLYVRADDGSIKGFLNICRHRAHPVAVSTENRTRRTLQCMYHGWTYDFEGGLVRAPRAEYEEADFDPESCGLIPVKTHVWGPTVWVNLDVNALPFSEWIAGLPETVEANGVDVDDCKFAFAREFEIRANWKVFVDNAVECYHCPTCHSQLSTVLVMNPHRQILTLDSEYWTTNATPFKHEDRDYFHHWIFPTTYFQYAGSEFHIGTVEVVDVDRIVFRSLVFTPGSMSAAEIDALEERLDESPTILEDVAICERVQGSHEVGLAPPGQLLPESEKRVLHNQRVYLEMMLEA